MHAITACKIVNQLIFRPGWSFHAGYSSQDTGSIYVGLRIETQDTNYPPHYQKRRTIEPDFTLNVAGLDEDGLLHAIMVNIAAINEHEDREFLRRGDRLDAEGMPDAPFHPHHYDGMVRWDYQQDMQERAA